MNDLQFENQLLQAEVTALRSEFKEATEKRRIECEKNRSLVNQIADLQTVNARADALEEENKGLTLELTQLKKEHVEIGILGACIRRLEDERDILKKTDVQTKISRLNEIIADQRKIVEEFARKYQKERGANERLKIEISSLSSRLSSSYLDWQRIKWKTISFTLGGCLVIGIFTSVWLSIQ